MGYALAANLSFCVHGETAILLDLARDRYIGLSPRLTRALLSLGGNAAEPAGAADVAALMARGIIQAGGDHGIKPCPPSPPRTASLFGVDRAPARAVATFAAMTNLLLCATRLRMRGILPIVTGLHATKEAATFGDRIATDDELHAIVAAFRTMSLLISRDGRCLIYSIALMRLLLKHGLDATLIFGVSTRPFSAHCWVQYEGIVLSDHLEDVRHYTPIMVV